jgi:uncharacterized membrane protein YphA (DoxX/SURF4 family)
MTTPTDERPAPAGEVLPSRSTLAKGLAVLRIFMGLVFLLNGLAKLFGFSRIAVGPYVANLIDGDATEFILRFEVFENQAGGTEGTRIPGLRPIAELILDNFALFGWAITAAEIVIGLLLVVGLATRGAALLGLGQALFLALVYATSNRWVFEQPHEYVPLIILAIVPAGRVWGLDGKILRRRGTDPGELRGWPF